MPVSRLLVEVPSWELTEWAGYFKILEWEQEAGPSVPTTL